VVTRRRIHYRSQTIHWFCILNHLSGRVEYACPVLRGTSFGSNKPQ